jgi:hypothetical protein
MNRNTKIFIWSRLKTWGAFIHGLMPQRMGRGIEAKIRENKQFFRYYDDPEPFKNIFSTFSDFDSLVERFVSTFRSKFDFVRMFHCCRPWSVNPYYTQGIRPLVPSEADKEFREICFMEARFSMISESDIKDAIDSMVDSYGRFGQVYFGIDDRFLIEHCGHYLIYGSEYLQSLASSLRRRRGFDLSSNLRQRGTPAVFRVNISVNQFEDQELGELADNALPAWAYCIAHDKRDPGLVDFAITIDETLAPENIIGHYHPKEVPDPCQDGAVYRHKMRNHCTRSPKKPALCKP